MSRLTWRVRMFTQRVIPHTPVKRLGYGGAVVLGCVALALGHPLLGAALFVLTVLARMLDLQRSGARRGRLPTARAYFFEGADDDKPPTLWRR